MSRAGREARGILHNRRHSRVSPRAERAEHNLTAASFQRWFTGAPAAALRRTITACGVTWEDVHEALAEFGCVIWPKGSIVVTTTLSGARGQGIAPGPPGPPRPRWNARSAPIRNRPPTRIGALIREKATSNSSSASVMRRFGPARARDDAERLLRHTGRPKAAGSSPSDSPGNRRSFERGVAWSERHCASGRSKSDAHLRPPTASSIGGRARCPVLPVAPDVLGSPCGPSRRPESAKRCRRQASERRALTEMLPRSRCGAAGSRDGWRRATRPRKWPCGHSVSRAPETTGGGNCGRGCFSATAAHRRRPVGGSRCGTASSSTGEPTAVKSSATWDHGL